MQKSKKYSRSEKAIKRRQGPTGLQHLPAFTDSSKSRGLDVSRWGGGASRTTVGALSAAAVDGHELSRCGGGGASSTAVETSNAAAANDHELSLMVGGRASTIAARLREHRAKRRGGGSSSSREPERDEGLSAFVAFLCRLCFMGHESYVGPLGPKIIVFHAEII
jgi:hypothetical protein